MQIVVTLCAAWCVIVAIATSLVAYEDLVSPYAKHGVQTLGVCIAVVSWIVAGTLIAVAINV